MGFYKGLTGIRQGIDRVKYAKYADDFELVGLFFASMHNKVSFQNRKTRNLFLSQYYKGTHQNRQA